MTKAAASHVLAILFATTLAASAQSGGAVDTGVAIETAVRRDANKILLRQKLTEASEALARHDLNGAAKIYDSAVELVGQIGANNCEVEAEQAVRGFSSVRLELAERARKRDNYREVDTQLKRVLKVDPKNPAALAAKAENDKTLKELAGFIPTSDALKEADEARAAKTEANTHVQNAKVLLDAGELTGAENELIQALQKDPQNRPALRYKDLVRAQRYQMARARQEHDNGRKILEVVEAYADSRAGKSLPVPNPYNRTDVVNTGKGRQAIFNKLNTIKFESFPPEGSPDTLPLSEVVRILSVESPKRDPEKEGVNIIINPNAPAAPQPIAPLIDPTTGLPIAAPQAETVDVGGINVKLGMPLRRVTLNQVLDAISKVAERPLKISYEEYAIVISMKGQELTPLFTREYDIDPNTFYQGLVGVSGEFLDIQSSSSGGGGGGGGGGSGQGSAFVIPRVSVTGVSGGQGGQGGGGGGGQQAGGSILGGTGAAGQQGGGQQGGSGLPGITRQFSTEAVSAAARQFFFNLGINLDIAQGKSVFFNDRKGILLVRATMEELDLIEQVIRVLNVAPPQVNIKTKFTEISQNDNKALGFDWYLGNMVVGGKSIASGGTQPTFNGAPSQGNPSGNFPGNFASGTAIAPSTSDGLVSGGLRNTFGKDGSAIPALGTFTGILTDPQFRVVLRAIEQRDGIDLLNEGQVTTLSGRQAQIQVNEVKTIVTGVEQNSGQGGTTASAGDNTLLQQTATFQTPNTAPVPLGPVIDVLPTVSSDGYTIQMTIIPTLTEFVGYDLATASIFVPTAITATGQTLAGTLPLPIFRVRMLTTSCSVWDGQTIVLGGLIADSVVKHKDKVPILADLPFFGKFFTSESSQTQKKNLVIFVTPRIIDPAGNPAHTDEEMPFAQASRITKEQ